MTSKRLSLTERETIIRTSEGEKTYGIYTHNKQFINRLEKLAKEHPKICRCISKDDEWGNASFVVAKDNVILTIKPKREMTAEERLSRSELMKENRPSKRGSRLASKPSTPRG